MLSPELTLLIQGRAILSDPAKWAQGAMAREIDDDSTRVKSPKACKWCSIGIILLLNPSEKTSREITGLFTPFLDKPEFGEWREGPEDGLDAFNDRQPYEKVLALWDAVIAAQYAKEVPPDLESIHGDL